MFRTIHFFYPVRRTNKLENEMVRNDSELLKTRQNERHKSE